MSSSINTAPVSKKEDLRYAFKNAGSIIKERGSQLVGRSIINLVPVKNNATGPAYWRAGRC